MIHHIQQAGVTLLEVMFVLIIFGFVTMLVLFQYQSAANDTDIQRIQYTVDTLFQGMNNYYRAYCRNPVNQSTGNVINNASGYSLDPRDTVSNPLSNNPFPIINNSQNWLTANSFLATKDWPPQPNTLVDTTEGAKGYVTQFNIVAPSTATRQPIANYTNSVIGGTNYGWEKTTTPQTNVTPPAPLGGTGTGVGRIYYWRAQVAVKIIGDATTVATYKSRLGADCISTLVGGVVTPCSSSPTTGNYLVWERSPSFGSSATRSIFWLTTRRIKQSTQQYTNDDTFGSNDPNWAGGTSWAASQYGNLYLCGG